MADITDFSKIGEAKDSLRESAKNLFGMAGHTALLIPSAVGDLAERFGALVSNGNLDLPNRFTSDNIEAAAGYADKVFNPVATAFRNAQANARQALGARPRDENAGANQTAGGALPSPAAMRPVPSSALPRTTAQPARRAATPGALSQPMSPMDNSMAESLGGALSRMAPAQTAPQEQEQPMPQRPSLQAMYEKLTGNIPKEAKGDLTPEQKKRLELEFFLNMMARSARPGAYALGAAGEAGVDALGKARTDEATNLTRNQAELNRMRDEALRTIQFADKDADNEVAARRATTDEKWRAAQENRDNQRLQLERDRLESDGKRVTGTQVLANGNIGLVTQQGIKDSGVKARAQASETDPITRGMESLRRYFPNESNEDLLKRFMGTKRDTERGQLSEDEMMRLAAQIAAQSAGTISFSAAMDQLRSEQLRGRGAGVANDGIARPKTREEVEKLPKGTRFVNPKDNEILTKK